MLGLHFLYEGAVKGEPGLFVALQENPSQLARVMLNLGWELEELIERGTFELM